MNLTKKNECNTSYVRFQRRCFGLTSLCLLCFFSVAHHTVFGQELEWPPFTDGLVFLWENGGESNTVPGDGSVDELCRLIPTGRAKFNRFWAMDVAVGAYHAEESINAKMAARIHESNQYSLVCVITPSINDYARETHIVSYGKHFLLAQKDNVLVFSLERSGSGQSQSLEIAQLSQNTPHHVVVTCGPNSLSSYLNGEPSPSSADYLMDSSDWEKSRLYFGQAANGSADWAGTIEGIAIYDRALSAEEAKQQYAAYAGRLEERLSIPPLVVDARLAEKRDIPKAEVYPNSLVVFDYHVNQVIKGKYDDQKILVIHWGNLNGTRQTATQDLRIGKTYQLTLEPYDNHPELAAIQIIMNEEQYLLPMYYAIIYPAGVR